MSSKLESPHICLEINQTCPICTDNYLLNELQAPLSCKHSFCSLCLKQYLTVKIKSNQILNISCPQSRCQEIFTSRILKGVLEPEIYAKYHQLVLKKIFLKTSQKALCPNPHCARQFSPVPNQAFSNCPCGMKICNFCVNPFHKGKSCIQTIDPKFANYAEVHGIKFCPVCKTIIAKDQGCNHMTCPVCDSQWCWACGQSWTAGHHCEERRDPEPPIARGPEPPIAGNPKPPTAGNPVESLTKRTWNEGVLWKRAVLILCSPILLVGFLLLWPSSDWPKMLTEDPVRIGLHMFFRLVFGGLLWPYLLAFSPLFLTLLLVKYCCWEEE